jgi:hypothetical protein
MVLQTIHQVQAKEFPVGEPDWHGLPKLFELYALVGYIDDSSQGSKNTIGDQERCIGRDNDNFNPLRANWEKDRTATDHCAIIAKSKTHGTRGFLHRSFDMFGELPTQVLKLLFTYH